MWKIVRESKRAYGSRPNTTLMKTPKATEHGNYVKIDRRKKHQHIPIQTHTRINLNVYACVNTKCINIYIYKRAKSCEHDNIILLIVIFHCRPNTSICETENNNNNIVFFIYLFISFPFPIFFSASSSIFSSFIVL